MRRYIKWINPEGLTTMLVCAFAVFALGWMRPRLMAMGFVLFAGFFIAIYNDVKGKRPLDSHRVLCGLLGIIAGFLMVLLNNLSV